MLVAKSKAVWMQLRQALAAADRSIEKRYLAVVEGPLADEGSIDVPLAHHGDSVRMQLHEGERPSPIFACCSATAFAPSSR